MCDTSQSVLWVNNPIEIIDTHIYLWQEPRKQLKRRAFAKPREENVSRDHLAHYEAYIRGRILCPPAKVVRKVSETPGPIVNGRGLVPDFFISFPMQLLTTIAHQDDQ